MAQNNEYFTVKEIMESLEISRSTVYNITIVVSKDDLNNKSKELEKKRGKSLVAVRELPNRLKFLASYYYDYLIYHEKIRDIKNDLNLIEESKISIDILGINALGPLHQGRERILGLLKKGGTVRILLLNPLLEAFNERERKEELYNEIITGRLRAEFVASIGICKDIINFSDFKDTIKIKVHNQTPKMALIISDNETENGSLNCNIYPKGKKIRGLLGSHKLHISKKNDNEHFNEYYNHFLELWENGMPIEEIELFTKNCAKNWSYKNIV